MSHVKKSCSGLAWPMVLWTHSLDTDLKRQIVIFGNKCLRNIMQLLRETESRPITTIIHQRQLLLYGHVALWHCGMLPEGDPVSWVVSERDNPWWRKPCGRPQSSWLGQVDASCRELLGMGRGLARGDRWGWCRRVGEATHPSAHAPND